MRRKDKALSTDAVMLLLQTSEYGVLSTADAQGQPYGVPLNFVFSRGCLYFHCALEGRKLDHLLVNRKVSFCVVGRTRLLPAEFSTEYESVIVFGEAVVVQGAERHQALLDLIEKYSPEFIDAGRRYIEMHDKQTQVVRIDIQAMTGKAKPVTKT